MPYSQNDFLSRMIAVNFAAEGSLRFSGGGKSEPPYFKLSPLPSVAEARRKAKNNVFFFKYLPSSLSAAAWTVWSETL